MSFSLSLKPEDGDFEIQHQTFLVKNEAHVTMWHLG